MYRCDMKRLLFLALLAFGWASAQDAEAVLDELRKTDRIIEEVRPAVNRSGVAEAVKLLAAADNAQQNGWAAYNARRLRGAYDLTMRARNWAQQARRLASVDVERVREEVRRTAEAIAEYGPLVTRANDQRANELWKMAQAEQDAARDYLGRSRYGLALKFTLAAREHGRAAFAAVRRSADPERVQRMVAKTGELVERATGPVKADGDERAMTLLTKAVDLQSQAKSELASRRLLRAVKLTLAARDLALRAWEQVRGRLGPEQVERIIAGTDELVDEWAGVIRRPGNDAAQQLFDQALPRQAAAREHLKQGRLKAALVETAAARNLVRRAIELVQPDEESSPGQK